MPHNTTRRVRKTSSRGSKNLVSRTVEDKAISDAKALLSAEQVGKLKKLARDTKPQSMMQGMKDKMEDAMSMHCPPMHGKAEH